MEIQAINLAIGGKLRKPCSKFFSMASLIAACLVVGLLPARARVESAAVVTKTKIQPPADGGTLAPKSGLANYAPPGTDANGVGPSPVAFGSIDPFVVESGFIYLSVDGMGTTNSSGTIRVVKPPGATVRVSYLFSASTGFTLYEEPNGSVTINGTPVNWDIQTPSAISSYNYYADVTTIVKPIIDAASPGTNRLTLTESNTYEIDGEILAVIFDDPNQVASSSVILLFGAQKTTGDTFNITLATPVDLSNTNLILDMALGISYGYQTPEVTDQFSIVTVNGQQLTQSAGGQDDGQPANGALITVGGVGDSDANPPPYQTVTNYNTDDELYTLKPFVTNGETTISVYTINPSGDDNIFFADLVVTGGAVVNEGILLTPIDATNLVGTSHTVTATVQSATGTPVTNRLVTFLVESGPNAGVTGTGTSDSNGVVTFTYVDNGGAGVDTIDASMIGSTGKTITSNEVLKNWVEPAPLNLYKNNETVAESVTVGEVFTYDISFDTYSSTVAAVDVQIVDYLPLAEDFVSATTNGATNFVYDPVAHTATWYFGEWPPLSAGPTNYLTVMVNSNAVGLTNIVNNASITSSNLPTTTTVDHNPRCPTCSGVNVCAAPVLTVTPVANRGYYQVGVTSSCYTSTQLDFYVMDTGSSFVAGPFAAGTTIKVKNVAATGVTGVGPASGVASVTVNVLGNAIIQAKDPSGTLSTTVSVLSL